MMMGRRWPGRQPNPDVDVSRAADEPEVDLEVAGSASVDLVAAREFDDDDGDPGSVTVDAQPDAPPLSADADDDQDEVHPAELSGEVEFAAADIETDDDSLVSAFTEDSDQPEPSEQIADPVLVATVGNVKEASRRSRLTRSAVPLLVLAAIVAGSAYFVGLRLGGPDDAGDELLGSQEASVPASRGTRAADAGDEEPAPVVAEVPEPVAIVEDEPAPVVVPSAAPSPPAPRPTATARAGDLSSDPQPEPRARSRDRDGLGIGSDLADRCERVG